MQQTEWSVVNRIFSQAVELAPEAREAWVHTAANGDPAVSAAVLALLRADEEAGEYLESPILSSSALESWFASECSGLKQGDILASRFRIVRLLGEGGMGRVYEAYDTEFQTEVAIKVIRDEVLRSPGMTERFLREARLARRLSHPNICRVYDFERTTAPGASESDTLCFITMEMLHGEDLASHLKRRGALPLEEAASIAQQTAEAIDAAHRGGVTHGDLKPANIMLCPECGGTRVVVTDFGLASPHPPAGIPEKEASATLASAPMGTLAYMAPEQLAGRRLHSSADIYALGLVLFEVLTGTRAFPDGNPLRGIAERLTAVPPSPLHHRSNVPESWCMAVARCLRIEPTERPLTARAAVAIATDTALARRWRTRSTLQAMLPARGRLAVWSFFLLVVVSLGAAAFRFFHTEATSDPPAAGVRMYLAPVRNFSGDARLNGVGAMLRASLAQSPQVTLLDQDEAVSLLQRMAKPPNTEVDDSMAREIAMRGGAARIVFVTLRRKSGGWLSLDVDLQQPDVTPFRFRSNKTRSWRCCEHSSLSEDTIPADLLHVVRDSSDWIRATAGEARNDIGQLNGPIEDITTMSWEALGNFQHAELLQAQGRPEDAVAELRNAIRHDGGFAMGYARLGDVLCSIGRQEEGLQSYRKALQLSEEHRLTRRERNRIRGLYALDSRDFATAAEIFRDTTLYYDRDFLAWFYRGTSLVHTGEPGQAIESLQHALAVRPHSLSVNEALASTLFLVGDTRGALQRIAQLRSDKHEPYALWLEAEAADLAGNTALATQKLLKAAGMDDRLVRLSARHMLVRLAWKSGDKTGADAAAADYLAEAERQGSRPTQALAMLDQAWLQCAAGAVTACTTTAAAALERSSSPTTLLMLSEAMRSAMRNGARGKDLQPVLDTLLLAEHRLQPATPGDKRNAAEDEDLGRAAVEAQVRGDLALLEGDTRAALLQYRRAANADTPFLANERLRRSLELVVAREPHGALSEALRTEAKKLKGKEPVGLSAYRWFFYGSFAVA